ncbi:MAG: hypothetical protein K6F72_00685 [Bacteroidales bacterium]|nr:hypothetical protein [Bacteroidales bacterium]
MKTQVTLIPCLEQALVMDMNICRLRVAMDEFCRKYSTELNLESLHEDITEGLTNLQADMESVIGECMKAAARKEAKGAKEKGGEA